MKKYTKYVALLLALGLLFCTGCTIEENRILQTGEKETEATDQEDAVLEKNIVQEETAAEKNIVQVETASEKEQSSYTEVSLLAVGDMLMHVGVSCRAMAADGSLNYDYLFENTAEKLQKGDIVVANNEVIFGGNELGLQGFPDFNVYQELGDAEVKAGFNVVLNATNHTMDQGTKGILNTLNFWKKYPEVKVLGIHENAEDYNQVKVIEKNGIRIALLNYTKNLNSYNLPEGQEYLVDLMNPWSEEKIRQDLEKAEAAADFTVVFPHWGEEYQLQHNAEQEKWAKFFAENGADLIIGTHPHCIQEVQEVICENGKHALCYYSLGNYVSLQCYTYTLLGGMADVKIRKEGDKTFISDKKMDFVVTHYNLEEQDIQVYPLENYTEELAGKHSVLQQTDPQYVNENAKYPFSVEGLKNIIRIVCPQMEKQ